MLNVSDATKLAYKDYGESRQVEIKIYTDTPITLTNSDIAIGTLSVEEILESGDNLNFIGCNASILKFKSANRLGDIKDKKVEVKIRTGNTDIIPLFTGYIDSAKNTSFETATMDIVAYDPLYKIKDLDFKAWYDALFVNPQSILTLKEMRDNFFTRVGIEQVATTLPNDNMTITKTIEDNNITGETILKLICQINGRYGRMTRDGKFEYVNLEGTGLYPSLTLYPSTHLYPSMTSVDSVDEALYAIDSISFEKYEVQVIDGVQLVGKDNQIIATAGVSTPINVFTVSNPLVWGKSQSELNTIAANLLDTINACYYVPLKLDMIGLPYLECGDYVGVMVKGTVLRTVILHRVLTGEQALIDNIESKGNEYQPAFIPNTDEKIQEAIEKAKEETDKEITEYDVAVRRMNELAVRSLGAYNDYEDAPTGGRIYYMSNMPITKDGYGHCVFDPASIAYKIDGVGFYISRPVSSPGSERVWENGYDAQTGELLINVLYAIGIHADWIVTGMIKDRNYDPNNPYLSNFWNLDDGTFSLRASTKVGGKTVQEIADEAQEAAEDTAAQALADAVSSLDDDIADLQNQIDGNITTWFMSGVPTLSNAPASSWDLTDRKNHIGDLYYDSATGYAYRFQVKTTAADPQNPTLNDFEWVKISDEDISKALAAARTAQATADLKIITYAQTTAPTGDLDVGDLWIDTDDNNKLHRWNGTSWVMVTDDSSLNAFKNGDYATFVTNTNTAISGKITTFYQTSSPTANANGDLWIDTDDGNKLYRWNGSQWINVQDSCIQAALTAAGDAQATADSKIVTYAQPNAPTGDLDVGDLWIDTDDSNKMYRWSGTQWIAYTDSSALNAFKNGEYANFVTTTNAALGEKITTYYQASQPTAEVVGDLWIDTDDSNKLYRWNGTSWDSVRDSGIQSALTAAANAQSTADGKIVTFAQSSQPTATDVGDLWIDTDDNNKLYRWNGSSWVQLTDTSATNALNESLRQQEIYNRLTQNGKTLGIFLEQDPDYPSDPTKKLLFVNASYMTAGTIADTQHKNFWDLDTGDLTMTGGANILLAHPDYSGAYVPTLSNAPASSWTTKALKEANVGKTFRDTSNNGKIYIFDRYEASIETEHPYKASVDKYYRIDFTNASFDEPYYNLIFDEQSQIEANNYDYLEIFWDYGGYIRKRKINTRNIGGLQVPAHDGQNYVWIHWHTDSSQQYWGWKITFAGTYNVPYDFEDSSLPTGVTWEDVIVAPYNWKVLTLETYTPAVIDSHMNQDEIFDALTNGGQDQGIYIYNGKVYLNGQFIKAQSIKAEDIGTGTLTVGGSGTNKPAIYVKDSSDNTIGSWTLNGITANKGTFGNLIINQSDSSIYVNGETVIEPIYETLSSTDDIIYRRVVIIPSILPFDKDFSIKYIVYSNVSGSRVGQVRVFKSDQTTSIEGYLLTTQQESASSHIYTTFNTVFEHDFTGEYVIEFRIQKQTSTPNFVKIELSYELTSGTSERILHINDKEIYSAKLRGYFYGVGEFASAYFAGWNANNKITEYSDDGVLIYTYYNALQSSYLDYSMYIAPRRMKMLKGSNYVSMTNDNISRYKNSINYDVAWNNVSDERVKENIEPLDEQLAIDFIDKTEPKKFSFINDSTKHYGMIAQEVRAVLDNLGETDAGLEYIMDIPQDEAKIPNQRALHYEEYIAPLIVYVQDLRKELNAVKEELRQLKEGK